MIDIETGGWLCINLILWDFIVAERHQQVDLLYNSFLCQPIDVKQCQLFLNPVRCTAQRTAKTSRHSAIYTVNFAAEKLLKYESGSPTQSPWKMDKIHKLHRTHQNTKCHFEKLHDTLILMEYGWKMFCRTPVKSDHPQKECSFLQFWCNSSMNCCDMTHQKSTSPWLYLSSVLWG